MVILKSNRIKVYVLYEILKLMRYKNQNITLYLTVRHNFLSKKLKKLK